MSALMEEMNRRALALGVPLGAQLDVTYRCNERCVHCYLDHDDHGEMTTAEMLNVLDQLADAGTLFLTLSGGEVLMRMDFFRILEYARELSFCVKIKTNAFMIGEAEADRMRDLGVNSVQVSIYSHRPEVHDAITLLPRSLERSINGIRFMQQRGLKVIIANVLMRQNFGDYEGVRALADSLGVESTIDPTVTPKMDGDREILGLGIGHQELFEVMRNPGLVGNVDEFCAPPGETTDAMLDEVPCSASHTYCYISPYGDVYPCVQFPLPTGNVRKQKFIDIWRYSPEMNEVRSIRPRELPVCGTCSHVGTCTRCPGLAYMEGNMRGPSSQDCEKSFARTGIPSANMHLKAARANLVQIRVDMPQSVLVN
ncbi:MAG TPA: radical SAM protein [Bryobacteraceae bacterium]|nr:radical SAM protein [Bryobacteraceae bacterium]